MSGPTERPRPLRRHVRLACTLRLAGSEVHGLSGDISASGLYVRVAKALLERAPGVGARLEVRFVPPEQPPVEGPAEVVWVNADDQDAGGRFSWGIGLKMSLSGEVAERLQSFLSAFRYTVLVLDRDAEQRRFFQQVLEGEYHVLSCGTVAEALEAFERHEVCVIVSDQRLEEMSAAELFERLAARWPKAHLVRIVASAHTRMSEIKTLINLGQIFYYLRKPARADEVLQLVRRAIDSYALTTENERLNRLLERANQHLHRENQYLKRRLGAPEGFERIVGNSPELQKALDELERIRRSEITVFLEGETGTGKELVARALHDGGPRKSGPFVAFNCAGIAETLLQSTLFGHRKGAFTGADRDHPGLFRAAEGGTLFLDEVAELTPAVQASLLRVLQEGEVLPLGATRPVKVDARIISASHQSLRAEVAAGRFREDLFYRLHVVSVRLPPLRERTGDPAVLARHFLALHCARQGKRLTGFTPDAMRALERHRWPGNVRELENEVERLVVLCPEGEAVPIERLSPQVREVQPARTEGGVFGISAKLSYDDAIEELQRAMVTDAMKRAGGVVHLAADLLGMERSRLAKLRRRLGLAQSSEPED
ncbi:MAG: sigma 54-interacting transcriptional regulator [Myxococcales bacterium]|nr:sigma 54-interacting transcriptional regulator [Myxococcales bacterium]